MKTYAGNGCTDPFILDDLALIGGEGSVSRPGRFTPVTHWIGSWVGARAGEDDVERKQILPPTGTQNATSRPSSL
jgi:hypothetical protein